MNTRTKVTSALFAASLIFAAQAQASVVDDRWLPFEGCWRADDAPASALLCIVPENFGVRLVEIADGKVLRDSRVVAHGAPQPISREGCQGNESARWSGDGQRLYLETRMTCGEQLERKTSGMFAMLSSNEWLSIHAIEVGKEAAVRTVKYTAIEKPEGLPAEITRMLKDNKLARETARAQSSQELDLHDVVEASGAVHGRAVEALLLARQQSFDLDGRKLTQLADAGVPLYLIDAVVAATYPWAFDVRPAKAMTDVVEEPRTRTAYAERCGRSTRYDPWCDDGYYYSRYSPWGGYYSPYSYGYGYGYNQPPLIVIRDPDGDDEQPRRNRGRITRDGYRSGESSSTTREPARGSVSADKSGTDSSSDKSSSADKSSSSGSTSSSSGATRKAKPRGSGN